MKRPAFQFYPADWRKDMALQSCGVAARGLWMDMLCIAHECEPYGHLTVNGKPMTAAQIGRHTGLTERDCLRLIAELEEAGVLSRADDGTIYSRRMVRDEDLRERRAETGRANGHKGAEHGHKGAAFGALGGRPKGGNNPPKDPPQEPGQNPRPSSSSSSSASAEVSDEADASSSSPPATGTDRTPTIPCPFNEIVARYHEALPMLPRVKLMPDKRQVAMRKLWAWVLKSTKPDGSRRATTGDEALQWFADYFSRAALNDWLTGRVPRSAEHATWQCDIDFLLTEKGMKAVIEKTEAAA